MFVEITSNSVAAFARGCAAQEDNGIKLPEAVSAFPKMIDQVFTNGNITRMSELRRHFSPTVKRTPVAFCATGENSYQYSPARLNTGHRSLTSTA